MKKQLLAAIGLLLLLNHNVYADEIRLRTTKTSGVSISVVTATATNVTVDWGNGTPITTNITQTDINGAATALAGDPTGEIIVKGDGITVFDCSGSTVTNITVTQAPNLIKLSVNNNTLTSIDLTQNTVLNSLHLEVNSGLTGVNVSNNTALLQLYCNDNNMTSLDVTKNINLTTLNFNNNKIVAIDLSKNTALKSLYALNNLIESINLSQNTALTYISLNTNKLTALDVTPITALKSLFVTNNNLTTLTGAKYASQNTLNCSGNKLNIATLSQPELLKTTYNYAPQQAYVIPSSIKVGEILDLTSQTNVKGISTTTWATTFVWNKKTGTALVKGTDYDETNGVFKFLVPQTETVICSMSTAAFPKFTTTNILKTTEMAVNALTGINEQDATIFSIVSNSLAGKLVIRTDATILNAEIYNAFGRRVFATTTAAPSLEINSASFGSGVYVVKVTTDKGSSTQKFIVR